jgi:hypothetical protein
LRLYFIPKETEDDGINTSEYGPVQERGRPMCRWLPLPW